MSNCTKSIAASTLRCISSSSRPIISILPASIASGAPHYHPVTHQSRGLRTTPLWRATVTTPPPSTNDTPPIIDATSSPPSSNSTVAGASEGRKVRRQGPMRYIESMPFQTYQLALQVLAEDRKEKQKLIKIQREKIAYALAQPEVTKESHHVREMLQHLERLKILADINNPRVKYNLDNGIVGLNKPVYRYLANRKWREMRRPILMQRLTQMHVIPDVLPTIDPVVDVQVRFKGKDVQPGAIMHTLRTEQQPTLKIIPFKPGEMLCTIGVMDLDVPDPKRDTYKYKLHWLVCNVPISTTQTQAMGKGAQKSDIIVDYLPPHVQKGIPYHRYAMVVFKQPKYIKPKSIIGKLVNRDTFNMRSFQAKLKLEAIGAFMWRNEFDSGTKQVMERHNIPGADVMWQRTKI